jgi:K+-transporting ATPase KdpF subunit
MITLYLIMGAVVAALFVYLFIAMLKPELFP